MHSASAAAVAVATAVDVDAAVAGALVTDAAAYSPGAVAAEIEVASKICDCPACTPAASADELPAEGDMVAGTCFLAALADRAVFAPGLLLEGCRREDSASRHTLAEAGLDGGLVVPNLSSFVSDAAVQCAEDVGHSETKVAIHLAVTAKGHD